MLNPFTNDDPLPEALLPRDIHTPLGPLPLRAGLDAAGASQTEKEEIRSPCSKQPEELV